MAFVFLLMSYKARQQGMPLTKSPKVSPHVPIQMSPKSQLGITKQIGTSGNNVILFVAAINFSSWFMLQYATSRIGGYLITDQDQKHVLLCNL